MSEESPQSDEAVDTTCLDVKLQIEEYLMLIHLELRGYRSDGRDVWPVSSLFRMKVSWHDESSIMFA